MSSQNLRETCKNTMKEKQKDSRLKLVNKLRNVPEETQTKSSPKNQTKKGAQDRYQMLLKWREEKKLKEQEAKKIERKTWNSSKNSTLKTKIKVQNEKTFVPDPAFSSKPSTQFSNLDSNDLVVFTGKGNSEMLKETNTRITRSSARKMECYATKNIIKDNTIKSKKEFSKKNKDVKVNKPNVMIKKIDKTKSNGSAIKKETKIEPPRSVDAVLRRSNRLKKTDTNLKMSQRNETTNAKILTKKNYAQTKQDPIKKTKSIESKISKKVSCPSVSTRKSCKVSSQENDGKRKINSNKSKLIIMSRKDENIKKENTLLTSFKKQVTTKKANEENRMDIDEVDMKGVKDIIAVNDEDKEFEEMGLNDYESKSDAKQGEISPRLGANNEINNDEETKTDINNTLDNRDELSEVSKNKEAKQDDNINIEKGEEISTEYMDELTNKPCKLDTDVKSLKDDSVENNEIDFEAVLVHQQKDEKEKRSEENRMDIDEVDMKGVKDIIAVNDEDKEFEEMGLNDYESKSDAKQGEISPRLGANNEINNDEETKTDINNTLDNRDELSEVSKNKKAKQDNNINIEKGEEISPEYMDVLTNKPCKLDTDVRSKKDDFVENNEIDTVLMHQRRATGTFFKNLMDEKRLHFDALISYWNNVASKPDFPKEGESHVRCTVGMAQLLMRERFQQFKGLVDAHVTGEELIPSRREDLQGFWEMVLFQVSDIESKFVQLQDLQKNNWLEKSACVKEKKKIFQTKKVSKVKACGPSKLSQFLAEKKRQKELQKTRENDDDLSTKDDVATFDGGFFRVDSPIKSRKRSSPTIQTSEIAMGTTPRTKVLRIKNDHCYRLPTSKKKQVKSFYDDSTAKKEKILQLDFDSDNKFEMRTKTPTKSLIKKDHCYVVPTEKRNSKMTQVIKDDSVSQKLDWSLMDAHDNQPNESLKDNRINKENSCIETNNES